MNRIKELPKSSSYLLSSTQIVTSVSSVIKELIENSIDSTARNVEIRLVDYGLEKIEVKDNGSGIHKDDISFVAKPHCTSKITSHLDLDKLETYGFRGEALAALCAVSELTISSRTVDDEFGISYTFDFQGEVVASKPNSLSQGTVIRALNIFKNVPVRKQLYRNCKVKKEELKKIENLLIAFGCIEAGLRFTLYHNQNLIWQKLTARSTSEGVQQVFGNSVFEHLENYNYVSEETKISIELFLPGSNSPKICSLTSPCRTIIAVNKRPVRMKILDKLVKEHFSRTLESGRSSCYPICYISINVPSSEVDVNLEPNKTSVVVQNMDLVVEHFSEALKRFYSKDSNTEVSSDINEPNLIQKNNDANSHKEMNLEKIQTFQMKLCNLEPKVQNVVQKDSENNCVKEANSENVIFINHMQKSLPKQECRSINSREKTSSEKLSRKNDLMTPSKKRVKTSSNISVTSTDMEKHIQTLDNYFSSSNGMNLAPNIVNGAHDVQKSSMNPNMNAELVCTEAMSVMEKDSELFDSLKRKRRSSDVPIEHSSKETSSLQNTSINDKWSRGIHPIGNVQPVAILKPKVTESGPSPNGNIKDVIKVDNRRESYGLFQNHRKVTPYDVFCRINRLEVAFLNPTMNNQQIAQILTEKWDQISPEEKAIYENENFSPKNTDKQEELPVIPSLNGDKEKTTSIKIKKSRKMKVKCLEKNISFNIETMNTLSPSSNLRNPDHMKVVNCVSPGFWICRQGGKLHLLNSSRLQEVVVYQRLLETFHLEADLLDAPYFIPTSLLDSDDMDVILQLNQTTDPRNEILISDEKLTANGFELEILKGEHEIQVKAIGLTKAIKGYGIRELKELLSLIKVNRVSTKLSDYRPTKVKLYLQAEAIRISRKYPTSKRLEDIEDLLQQQKLSDICMHFETFLTPFYDFIPS